VEVGVVVDMVEDMTTMDMEVGITNVHEEIKQYEPRRIRTNNSRVLSTVARKSTGIFRESEMA
jgi:hypothetical protein